MHDVVFRIPCVEELPHPQDALEGLFVAEDDAAFRAPLRPSAPALTRPGFSLSVR